MREAFVSARRIKALNPDVNITLVTNPGFTPDDKGAFDVVSDAAPQALCPGIRASTNGIVSSILASTTCPACGCPCNYSFWTCWRARDGGFIKVYVVKTRRKVFFT